MKRLLWLAWFVTMAALPFSDSAQAQRAEYNELVAKHARANAVPEALVHRVIVRESRYQPALLGRGGTIGLMQIKLATARGLGYTGDAEGLRDPNTNLLYGVKYLAGAYRVANGDHDRAIHYYASGYYEAAKHWRIEHAKHPEPLLASAPPKADAKPAEAAKVDEAKSEETKPEEIKSNDPKPEQAKREETVKAVEAAKLDDRATPVIVATPAKRAKPKAVTAAPKDNLLSLIFASKPARQPRKKLADAKADAGEQVPRPPARIPAGANPAQPR
jgi:Transglycosylase SLT domain